MNRNTMSFDSNPVNIDMSRSTFNRDSSLKTSFNVGDVVPFYIDEILPGDTLSVNTNKVVRLQTPITPFMDYLYLDTYYFFVPNRILWDHWKELHGENNDSAWKQEIEYEVLGYLPQSTKSRRLRLLLVVGVSVLLLIIWVYLLVLVVSLSTLFLLEHTL